MKLRVLYGAILIPAAAAAVGLYFNGGLAAYGGVEVTSPGDVLDGDMGTSWQVGGGLAVPVWWWRGAVTTSLELATDFNFSTIDNEFENPGLRYINLKVTAVPIREAIIFGIGVGPRAMIKPYVGFGGGVTIVAWKAYYAFPAEPDYEIDNGTAVKPTFGIPFGCDIRLTPNFSLGPRVEYLIITGEVDGYNPWPWADELFEATVPNIFSFGAQARFDF